MDRGEKREGKAGWGEHLKKKKTFEHLKKKFLARLSWISWWSGKNVKKSWRYTGISCLYVFIYFNAELTNVGSKSS